MLQLFHPKGRTLHWSLLHLIWVAGDHFSSLPRSSWIPGLLSIQCVCHSTQLGAIHTLPERAFNPIHQIINAVERYQPQDRTLPPHAIPPPSWTLQTPHQAEPSNQLCIHLTARPSTLLPAARLVPALHLAPMRCLNRLGSGGCKTSHPWAGAVTCPAARLQQEGVGCPCQPAAGDLAG